MEQTIVYHRKLISKSVKDGGLPQDAVPEAWQRTEEVRDLHEKNMALELDVKIFRQQADIRTD